MVAHTGNALVTPLIRTGPRYLDTATLGQYPRHRCGLLQHSYVYCPAVPTVDECPCINRTADLRLAWNQHTGPEAELFWKIAGAGYDAFAGNFNASNGGRLVVDKRSSCE